MTAITPGDTVRFVGSDEHTTYRNYGQKTIPPEGMVSKAPVEIVHTGSAYPVQVSFGDQYVKSYHPAELVVVDSPSSSNRLFSEAVV